MSITDPRGRSPGGGEQSPLQQPEDYMARNSIGPSVAIETGVAGLMAAQKLEGCPIVPPGFDEASQAQYAGDGTEFMKPPEEGGATWEKTGKTKLPFPI